MMTRDEAMRLAEDVRSYCENASVPGLMHDATLAAIVDRHVAQAEAPGITSTFATLFCASQDMRTAIKQHWPGTTGELYALEEWCRQHRDPERAKEVREAEAQQPCTCSLMYPELGCPVHDVDPAIEAEAQQPEAEPMLSDGPIVSVDPVDALHAAYARGVRDGLQQAREVILACGPEDDGTLDEMLTRIDEAAQEVGR